MFRKFNTFYLFFLFFFAEYFYPVSFLFFNNIRIKIYVFCYAQEKLIRSTKKNIIKFLEIYHFTKKKNIKFHFTEWFEQSEALNRVLETLAIIYFSKHSKFSFRLGSSSETNQWVVGSWCFYNMSYGGINSHHLNEIITEIFQDKSLIKRGVISRCECVTEDSVTVRHVPDSWRGESDKIRNISLST